MGIVSVRADGSDLSISVATAVPAVVASDTEAATNTSLHHCI